jgi:hypothetical protein
LEMSKWARRVKRVEEEKKKENKELSLA